ncbi:MAG: hypothetical protein R3E53_04425 [Myxococcota bacterium]
MNPSKTSTRPSASACSSSRSSSPRAKPRTRSDIAAIRRGVKARITALRIAVCSGGSSTISVFFSGTKPLGTTPSLEEKDSGSLIAARMSA